MPKVHTYIESIPGPAFDVLVNELLRMPEYPGADANGWLVGLDQVPELFRLSRRSGLAVRFRDCGFPIVTAWQWLGHGVGVAYMLTAGPTGQLHLMLSGTATEDRPAACAFLKQATLNPEIALRPAPGPALITIEREGYTDEAGGYLLGMILIAPFCECCGVADDPA